MALKILRYKFFVLFILFIFIPKVGAIESFVVKYPTAEVLGTGPYPYNYRVIDKHIHAGGHPLNPRNNFKNTDEEVLSILSYLKKKGVSIILDLENTKSIQDRYNKLLKKAGIKRVQIPLSNVHTPNKEEWAKIKNILKGKVYVHCKWGADRTGAIIGRYLVEEKNFTKKDAYKAVITGGTHAGYLGGLKTSIFYLKLKNFIFEGPK